jgi:DNA-binding MarR family transcriptional regulator
MDSTYDKIVYVLLCINQRLDPKITSEQREIDIGRLKELLDKLVYWGLVEVEQDSIVYKLSQAGQNILNYNDNEPAVNLIQVENARE